MNWNRYIRGVLVFYKSFWIPATLITLFCCIGTISACLDHLKEQSQFYGILIFIPPFFWAKIVTDILILLFIIKLKEKELYFYFNLGISRWSLWVSMLLIDFTIFFLVMYVIDLSFKLVIFLCP